MTRICRTDGAIYEINIYEKKVVCVIELPPTANVFAVPIESLRQRVHDGMEEALSIIFPQYGEKR